MRTSLSKRRLFLVAAVSLAVVAATATAALSAVSATAAGCSPSITKAPFGDVNGEAVDRYTLKNCKDMEVKILTYGGILQEISVPDRQEQGRERHAGVRQPRGLRRQEPVLRLHHGPVREPDRAGPVHARRRHVPAADQQPAELAARRHGRIRQARLGGDAVHDREDRRARPRVHEPRRRSGLPGRARPRRSRTR